MLGPVPIPNDYSEEPWPNLACSLQMGKLRPKRPCDAADNIGAPRSWPKSLLPPNQYCPGFLCPSLDYPSLCVSTPDKAPCSGVHCSLSCWESDMCDTGNHHRLPEAAGTADAKVLPDAEGWVGSFSWEALTLRPFFSLCSRLCICAHLRGL